MGVDFRGAGDGKRQRCRHTLLLDRAVAAGEIRADIQPENLVRAVVGMCYMHDQPGWQASVLRLMDVLVDGLRLPVKISKANKAR